MTHNATRPAALALALAFTFALWMPTLSSGGTANAATIPQAESGHLAVTSVPSIVLM